MNKQDAEKLRRKLESQHPYKPNFWQKTKKFLNDYTENPKDMLAFRISGGYNPIGPKEVRKKVLKKLNMNDYTDRLYNKALVKRYLDRKDYLGAYEAFWSTWNPPVQKQFKNIYKKLGGNAHSVRATTGTWMYAVAKHAVDGWPIYIAEAALGAPNLIPITIGGIAALYTAAGIPVIYSKWKHSRQNKPI